MISETTNEDCMQMMARYPDKWFELAIVDPPYGIGADVCAGTLPIVNTKYNKGRAVRKAYHKVWDEKPDGTYFTELFRVSTNQIIWGANYFIEYLHSSSSFIIWDKVQEFTGADFELAFSSFKGSAKAFRMARIAAYSAGNWKSVKGSKIHPTQKPVALYKWLMTHYAKQGDKILDTHLGSQSSRIAAWDLGFDFYGCELDGDYFREGNERFERHRAQPKLFAPEIEIPKQTSFLD